MQQPQPMDAADPFGTAALRDSVLTAWALSPTRLREDAAAEADLVRAGYRDRLFTELAQNAADAAAKAGCAGHLRVWAQGGAMHFANTGTPLDIEGVQAMSALRASGKSGLAGRFGVGFTAVVTVSDDISIRSATGSIQFSAAATTAALTERGITPVPHPPLLRLPWPEAGAPLSGFATEVIVRLRAGSDPAALLAGMATEAPTLLLELPALDTIVLGEHEYHRSTTSLPSGLTEVRIGDEVWWQYQATQARWLLPVAAGAPSAVRTSVLHAPTRSDEELSVPAILIADIAMQPDRRRVLPGTSIGALADGYAAFAAALPPSHRLRLVPENGLPRSRVDEELRAALLAELRDHAWLPGSAGQELLPARATVIIGLTAELAQLLADVLAGLLIPPLSGPRNMAALAQLGVHIMGLAELADSLSGLDRPPSWWQALYAALDPLVTDQVAAAELGALPVPLADGRLVTGPRTTVVSTALDSAVPVRWARLVHPEAAHPLLERLGTRSVSAHELLTDPALREELATGDTTLADTVLIIAGQVSAANELPEWLGLLELSDSTGGHRPADELLLRDSPLAAVLDADTAFVAPALVARYGARALRAVGVGWGFTVLREEYPTAPDHGLPLESSWWAGLAGEPAELAAVLDLDLVADDQWATALSMLAGDPAISPLLADANGYTAWWLRTHAQLAGVPLGALRPPDDDTFAGLLDAVDHPAAGQLRSVLADPARITPALAQELVDALADPARHPSLAVITRTHQLLATVDSAEVEPPPAVRAIDGGVIDPADALVLDQPWLAAVLPPARLVLGDIASAAMLADLLDVAVASTAVHTEVVSTGRRVSWAHAPAAALARLTMALPEAEGDLIIHDELVVRVSGAVTLTVRPGWWVDAAGLTHLNTFVRI